MPQHRHKKLERSVEPPGQLRIQPRDYEILRDLAEYRFMDMEQILALHDGGMRNLQRRLRYMYHLGIVDRPQAQKTLFHRKQSLVYSLGEKGAELVGRADFVKAKGVGFPYLDHAMMISQFRAVLTVALREYPARPKLTRWLQGYDLKTALKQHGQSSELVPDAAFTIEENGDLLDFFLEADRSTMVREKVLQKMKTYWKWHREKRYVKTLGIENFRVLTLTLSQARADNLREMTKQADDRRTGSNMFLFLPRNAYSLEKPESILQPIWMSAKGEKHGLLE